MLHRLLTRTAAVVSVIAGTSLAADPGKPHTNAVVQPQKADPALAVRHSNRFAIDLFRQMDSKTDNVFIAPWSVSIALDMARAGAAGSTRDSMTAALRLNTDAPGFDTALVDARKTIGTVDKEWAKYDYVFTQANRIWADRDEPMHESYGRTLAERFGADAVRADFKDRAAVAKDVNAWAAEKTRNLIPTVIGPNHVPPRGFILANAIYFKGTWRTPFKKEATREEAFTTADGRSVKVQMMRQSELLPSAEMKTDKAGIVKVAQIAYNGPASMLLILPEEGKVEQVIATLDVEAVRSQLHHQPVRLSMPRLSIDTNSSLKPQLSAMGMAGAFDPAADFSLITSVKPCHIGDVVHAAALRVDEEKTEAAGVTVMPIPTGSPRPQEPMEMKLDRPFILAITHEPTGAVLFIGRVNNPAK